MGARLLTGATDGVGLALARWWNARGQAAFLHGRKPIESLDRALFDPARYVQADLVDPGAPGRIARFLDERGVAELEFLVLNAAQGWVGEIEDLTAVRARALLEVDLIAPLHLCHLLLPRLRRARGRIVFVSSIAAQMAAPRYAVYAAAKAAAEGFFRSLRVELEGEVDVQVLCLGAVRTGLHEKSGLGRSAIPWERFPAPEQVARALDSALDGSARWRTIGIGNRAVRGVARALPGLVDRLRSPRAVRGRTASGFGRRCAVTGGAQGIGRALAERFARAGFALTLIDVERSAGEAAQAELARHGTAVELLHADLAQAGDVEHLLAALAQRPPFELFVHNAGINAVGRFGALAWEEQRRVLELDLVAPLVLTGGLLRAQRLAAGGAFVCVSSLSRFISYPGASAYAASKDGLAHFARSLRAALAPHGQHVLTVYPGPTRTAHAHRHSPDNSREAQRMAPEDLAERVYRALARRRSVSVPGLGNQLMAIFGHLAPRIAERAMKRTIFDKLE